MYCPSCGKQAIGNQKFCRSCGFELTGVTKLLADHPRVKTEEDIRNDKRGARLVFWGLIGSVGGIGVAFLGDKVLGEVVPSIGGILEGTGAFMMASGFALLALAGIRELWHMAYGKSSAKGQLPERVPTPSPSLDQVSERSPIEAVPSVTEDPTEPLEPPAIPPAARAMDRQKQ